MGFRGEAEGPLLRLRGSFCDTGLVVLGGVRGGGGEEVTAMREVWVDEVLGLMESWHSWDEIMRCTTGTACSCMLVICNAGRWTMSLLFSMVVLLCECPGEDW